MRHTALRLALILLALTLALGTPAAPARAGDTAPAAESDAGAGAADVAKTADPDMQPEGPAQLPVPRFVTLGAEEVNLRNGPGIRYPIRLVIRKHGLPVEVIRQFDVWRQVRDQDGDEGWIHKTMLSGRRAVIVTGATQTLRREPEEGARPVVRLEPGVIAALDKCKDAWCEVSVGGYTGWIGRANVWGVYPDEEFKD